MNGQFIVLEGPDGSGSTTHAKLLTERLKAMGTDVLLTWEPTTGPIGTFIRAELAKGTITAEALQILFTADRSWHVSEVIMPALEAGKIVICERYWLSTVVYAHALGIETGALTHMNEQFIQPDLQIMLLPPLEVCLERLGKRATRDMLETDSLQKRVYDGYKQAAEEMKIPIVDSSTSKEETAEKLLQLLQSLRSA